VERSIAEALDVAAIFHSLLRVNHEEDKFPGMRDDLPAFLGKDQGNNTRRDYLVYPIQFPIQSNNNTVLPRLIYNMTFP
jgi:hypothetical protein